MGAVQEMRARLVEAGSLHPDDITDWESMRILQEKSWAYQITDRQNRLWNHWVPWCWAQETHEKWLKSKVRAKKRAAEEKKESDRIASLTPQERLTRIKAIAHKPHSHYRKAARDRIKELEGAVEYLLAQAEHKDHPPS
jgi:hypothetical protein